MKKKMASKVFELLRKEKANIKRGNLKNINFSKLKKQIKKIGIKKVDYIELINLSNLNKAKKFNERFNIFTAFYVKKVRLIDNF